jgi:hypothetical protein
MPSASIPRFFAYFYFRRIGVEWPMFCDFSSKDEDLALEICEGPALRFAREDKLQQEFSALG